MTDSHHNSPNGQNGISAMFVLHMDSADGNTYHDGVPAGRAPIVAAGSVETAVSVLTYPQDVEIHRIEPVYDGPDDDDITGWMPAGGPVRNLSHDLVALRDRVDMHPTAKMGSNDYGVYLPGSDDALIAFSVEWWHDRRQNQ